MRVVFVLVFVCCVVGGCSYRGDAAVDFAGGALGVASDVTDLVLHLRRGEQQAFVASIDIERPDDAAGEVLDVRPSITVRAFAGSVTGAVAIEDFAADAAFVDIVSDEPLGLPSSFFANTTIDAFSFALRCVDAPDDDGVDLDVRVVAAVSAFGPIAIVLGRLEPLPE